MRGGLNGDRGRLLPGVGAGADELNNIVDAIRHEVVLRSARFLLKQCRADTLVPTPADAVGEGMHSKGAWPGERGEGAAHVRGRSVARAPKPASRDALRREVR